ncbi:MAG: hypothetical protein MUP74_03000, partial [Desulfobacterales bacterium]|nr:hypothetical protein [Desulfobacterales bacterium]
GHEIDLMQEQIREVSAGYLNQLFETLLKEESFVRFATQPKLAIEMICIRLLDMKPALPIDQLIDKLDRLQQALTGTTPPAAPVKPPDPAESAPPTPVPPEVRQPAAHAPPADEPLPEPEARALSDDPWEKIYARLTDKYPSLAANLAQSRLQNLTQVAVEIEASGSDFNLNMIRRPKNMAILKKVLRGVFGREMQVAIKARAIPQESVPREKKEEDRLKREALNHSLVTEAVEIFSGKVIDVKIL